MDLYDTAKGVACETRSKSLPSLVSLAVGSIPRAKRMRLLALMDHLNVLAFCCTNNRILISFFRVRRD